ncbi:MAG: S26 family signal peptidase [Bacteroidaceae bacterium]|nr:S26 family signal peptidase [Bacteroidaceae bacterium]
MTKKKRYKATAKDWVKAIIAIALYIAFLYWVDAWWGLIVIPFIFDAYVTRLIPWTWWKDAENPIVRTVMSWVDAIVFALVAVYFVNIYFFQNYTIPSSSLEKSLLVGDYLLVSKMSYGPRVPQTPLHMPLCQHTLPFGGKSYFEWPQWEYKRVTPKPVKLNDIVVFNYPAGDTIVSVYQTEYYAICYSVGKDLAGRVDLASLSPLERYNYYAKAYELGRRFVSDSGFRNRLGEQMGMRFEEYGEVDWRPVDRRENYVKRCVGLPGQTLEIRDRVIYLDGKENPAPKNVQFNYHVELKTNYLPDELVHEIGLTMRDVQDMYQSGEIPLTAEAKKALEAHPEYVSRITPIENSTDERLYPQNGYTGWSQDNYGPIWIPKKGESVKLTIENLPIYERPIRVYEGNDLKVTPEGEILINGTKATEYTFKMDYYWMQGDNRHCSADSRYWGFVPEDHIVGKPIFIWLSTDADRSWFSGHHIRWSRLFRLVDNIK